jgi:putative DNA methylase
MLPVEALAALALREAQRPREVYQAHKWFARRFGSAFRGLLVGSVLPVGADFWKGYIDGVDLTGKVVCDPFVGGGTSVVEALRLGADVMGIDVDEVACAVTRFETKAATMPDLSTALQYLQAEIAPMVKCYYTSTGPEGPEIVLHFFWVQVVRCSACSAVVEAHPHYQLAYDATRDLQWAFCRLCHTVQELPWSRRRLDCFCGTHTQIHNGTVSYGVLTCPSCSVSERLIDGARRRRRPPEWRLFALETLDSNWTAKRVPITRRRFRPTRRCRGPS